MGIARVALPVATDHAFDYWIPDGLDLSRGSIVRVRLGTRNLVGVVLEVVASVEGSHDSLHPIRERVDLPELPADVMDLAAFASAYYQQPAGLAYALAVPPLSAATPATRARWRTWAALAVEKDRDEVLRETCRRSAIARRLLARLQASSAITSDEAANLPPPERKLLGAWVEAGHVVSIPPAPAERVELNEAQRDAVAAIAGASGHYVPSLLDGVTGSGKSEVYLSAIAHVRLAGQQALLLVPEINLTPQLEARIRAALPGIRAVPLHSGLASGDRRANWIAAARGEADLVVGTRLAVFAPLPNLGLVVVDEEHDGSYKQQEGVRYHGRDLAVWRARRRGIPVVLGSATPSLESALAARSGRYRRLSLPRRADPRAGMPVVRIVAASATTTREGIAEPLWQALRERRSRGEQSLVFVNRRGFAPSLKCAACGWQAECAACTARMTLHRVPAGLRCHHCGRAERVPAACPSCGNVDLLPRGHGTQRLEQSLTANLPGARIARVDRDSTRRRGTFARVRQDVEANAVDVLVGTQMLAKGHDFPRLTLVGVLGADNALYSADFRATERLAALLMQVAGRAGRADLPGEVIVQTDFPDHPVFAALRAHDHASLVAALLDERKAADLPPFARLALVTAESRERSRLSAFLDRACATARALAAGTSVEVFAPVAAALSRRAGYERGQMLLRHRSAGELGRVLTPLRSALVREADRGVRWAIDVDPDSVS